MSTEETEIVSTEPTPKPRRFTDAEKPETIEVELKGKVHVFTINEMDPTDFAFWLRFSATRVSRDKQGRPKPESMNMEKFHATLISLCLRTATGDKLSSGTIDKWGTKLKIQLFKECEKKNGLDLEEDDDGKK